MCAYRLTVALVALVMAGVVSADEGNLPPPGFRASLVCFNGKNGSGSNCRVTMAKIDGGLKVVTGKLRCGFKGAASEIEWTYRGQKDGKDLYHVVRKFPLGSKDAITSEVDVSFDGKRQVIFEDQAQCIVIEVQPGGK